MDHVPQSRFLTKKRSYNTPSLPGSPYYGTFGHQYMASPGMFNYHPGFPMNGSPWMSPYSSSAPPSPAQLASFYYAQENSPDHYHPSNRFPYAYVFVRFSLYDTHTTLKPLAAFGVISYAADFRYPEPRPFMSRTYSQQH